MLSSKGLGAVSNLTRLLNPEMLLNGNPGRLNVSWASHLRLIPTHPSTIKTAFDPLTDIRRLSSSTPKSPASPTPTLQLPLQDTHTETNPTTLSATLPMLGEKRERLLTHGDGLCPSPWRFEVFFVCSSRPSMGL